MNPMLKGVSLQTDGAAAVVEAVSGWSEEACAKLNFILVYHSSRQSAEAVASAIAEKFPNIPSAGCTTAGEFLDGERYEGALVLCGFTAPELQWQVTVVPSVAQYHPSCAQQVLTRLTAAMGERLEDLDPRRHFVMLLQDGLAMREELISAAFALELDRQGGEILLLGGSAGDDLQFRQTWQMANGVAYSGAAVVILCNSELPFYPLKHQHYEPESTDFVVTDVDLAQRNIKTLNGYPAAAEFARAIGSPVEALDPDSYAHHPLIYCEKGEQYVRSIQKVEEDGSLTFYCGVEEGMLLYLGHHRDPNRMLRENLEQLKQQAGEVSMLLLFSCILCKLDLKEREQRSEWGEILHQFSPNVIGFDTYGELLNGLHINQTLVAIAFGEQAGEQ